MRITQLILTQWSVFLCAVIGTGAIRRFAVRTGLLDHPTPRSSHIRPTPRSGGGAIVVCFLAALIVIAVAGLLDMKPAGALILGSAAIAVVGFVDDRRSLPAFARFCVHVGAAALAVLFIGTQRVDFLPYWGGLGSVLVAGMSLIGLVWSTNLFNFMDGIDGIAGCQAVFVAGAGAWISSAIFGDIGIAIAFLCLCSATAGFLVWNWPPAKIFMGDVGSGFLGFSVAGLCLLASQRSGVSILVWVILNGVFLVDATVTLLRRMLRGERWFEPHRLHAYQHLSRRWKSHLPVTLSIAAINVGWLLPWAWFAAGHAGEALPSLCAAIVPIVVIAFLCRAGATDT